MHRICKHWGILLLTMFFWGCTSKTSSTENSPVIGFWKNEEGSQVWIFENSGQFYFGKLKLEKIHVFMCGEYKIREKFLLIHDALGNDLEYEWSIHDLSLTLSSEVDSVLLYKLKPAEFEKNCKRP